jgi:acyl-homoserine-lactone acylase
MDQHFADEQSRCSAGTIVPAHQDDRLCVLYEVAELKANSSNNTLFSDRKGEIALLLPQFMPKRDDRFDYTKPVDGADPATDWQGLTPLSALPHVLNPSGGWVFNTNDWPYSAAGADSPKRRDYPKYMDTAGENPRGIHAVLLLTKERKFTLESLMAAAFDPYLPAFARLIPKLVEAYDGTPNNDPLKARLKDRIALLRDWDCRWSDHSLRRRSQCSGATRCGMKQFAPPKPKARTTTTIWRMGRRRREA